MMKKTQSAYIVKSLLVVTGLALWICQAANAADMPAQQAFGTQKSPSKDISQSIGFYSKGCLAGAKALPVNGPNWQVMRLSRNRNWGHPALIAFLENLSRKAAAKNWPGLLVGDLSQPRGGPMLNGHASHQVGLDADIWFTPMPARTLSEQERETMTGISMLKANSLYVDPKKWSASRTDLLKLAATDPQTERIFVHPGIKKYLCDTAGANQSWLGKIRPYWGHYWHFHVRMKCQSDSPNCQPQPPVPKGSGCDSSLDWWFTDEPWVPKKTIPPAKPKVMMVSDFPDACAKLVEKTQR